MLTVLRTTITKPELIGIMRQFAVTFKGSAASTDTPSPTISEGSFASDEKPTKGGACRLMRPHPPGDTHFAKP